MNAHRDLKGDEPRRDRLSLPARVSAVSYPSIRSAFESQDWTSPPETVVATVPLVELEEQGFLIEGQVRIWPKNAVRDNLDETYWIDRFEHATACWLVRFVRVER